MNSFQKFLEIYHPEFFEQEQDYLPAYKNAEQTKRKIAGIGITAPDTGNVTLDKKPVPEDNKKKKPLKFPFRPFNSWP